MQHPHLKAFKRAILRSLLHQDLFDGDLFTVALDLLAQDIPRALVERCIGTFDKALTALETIGAVRRNRGTGRWTLRNNANRAKPYYMRPWHNA